MHLSLPSRPRTGEREEEGGETPPLQKKKLGRRLAVQASGGSDAGFAFDVWEALGGTACQTRLVD